MLAAILVFGGGFFAFQKHAFAATGINKQINFQGKVTNTDGTNVADNISPGYSFTFRIYDAASGGTLKWTETKNVHVTDGIFQTNLGDTNTTLGTAVDFNSDNIYLSIEFAGNGEMNPRVQFTAAPYAMNAAKVGGLTVTDTTGTLTIPNSTTVQFAGAFSTVGAFPVTLNASASTNVTLPTSGTLMADPTTTQGDLIYRDATGPQRLAGSGTNGWVLTYNTSTHAPYWSAASGGMNNPMTAVGDMIYGGTGGTPMALADVAAGQPLLSGGITTAPAYAGYTFAGTAAQTYTFPAVSGTLVATANDLSVFASTTSAQLAGVLSDENTTNGFMTNPMSTAGDIIFAGASGLPTRLAGSGTNGWVLTYDTSLTHPVWAAAGSSLPAGSSSQTIRYDGANWVASSLIFNDGTNAGIGTASSTGTFTLGMSTLGNIINIGAAQIATGNTQTIHIGDSATGTGADVITMGNTNGASALTLSSGTAGTTFNSNATTTNAFNFSNTLLTSGNGINLTVGNPAINSTVGTLGTGDLLNIASANHSYMSLDNRDLTLNGHKNNISGLTGVNQVYIYDTSKDIDGGRWTGDERALSSSWYNETVTATTSCVTGTNTRCGGAAFPKKAIVVAANDSVYIFDAKDNSLWMKFNQAATTALGAAANNEMSSVTALNGQIVVGTNGSAATGLYVIDFIKDKITRYNGTDARDYIGAISARNTAQAGTSADYPSQLRTSMALPNAISVVNDVSMQLVNGKTYLAAALIASGTATQTNGPVVLLNLSDQTTANFGIASGNFTANKVFLTPVGDLYWTVGATATPTNYFLKVKHSAQSVAGGTNNSPASEVYGNTAVTTFGPTITDAAAPTFPNGGPAPIDATFVPTSLFVTTATSTSDGIGNTIYVGNADNLMVINENRTTVTNGTVKYFDTTDVTDEIYGNPGGMWSLNEAVTPFVDSAARGNSLTASNISAFQTSGVRGKGATFAATSTATSAAGTLLVPYNTAGITVSAWVKPSAVTVTNGVRESIVTADLNVANQIAWGIGTKGNATDAQLACWATSTTPTLAEALTSVNVQVGNWYHVVETVTAAGAVTCYVNGVQSQTASTPGATGQTPTQFQTGATRSTLGLSSVRGVIDEVTVLKQPITAAVIRQMYDQGYRASQTAAHTANTLRGTSVAADAHNAIYGSSQVNGVGVDMEKGNVFAATNGGGINVFGMNNDTLVDLVTTNATDDTGTALSSNTTTSVSVAKGFGINGMFVGGYSTGLWTETGNSNLKDILAQSYNPFGSNLTQSQLNVDQMLRVVGQATSFDVQDALANKTITVPDYPAVFQVDSYGNLLARSLINSTTAFQFLRADNTSAFTIDTSTPKITSAGNLTIAAGGLTVSAGLTTLSAGGLTYSSAATSNVSQTTTTSTTDAYFLSAASLTTAKALNVTMGAALTTGGLLNETAASYTHATGANELGNLMGLTFTETTQTANTFISTTNGLDINSTINVSGAGTGTRNTSVINVEAPTFSACAAGTCNWVGMRIQTANKIANLTSMGLYIKGSGSMTTENALNIDTATFNHATASEIGNLANISFTDASSLASAGNTISNGLLISPTLNTSGATGTKETNGIRVNNAITACTGGNCLLSGLKVVTATSGALATVTQNGLTITGTGVALGALTGIDISAITAGAGTETAIKIGSGWDTVLTVNGTTVISSTGALNVGSATGTLIVGNGGTGVGTFTTNGILYGNGTSAVGVTAAGGAGTLCLVETAGGTPSFGACSGSTAVSWSSITAPSANLALFMAANTTAFTWGAATGASNMLSLTDTSSNTGTGYVLSAGTAASSAAKPFSIVARGSTIFDTSATGVITVTGGSGSVFGTSAGNVILQPAGSGTTANVQIGAGNGVSGSDTLDLLVLDDKGTTGDPTGVAGAMYYNIYAGTFRCYENGTWKNCINSGASGGVTLGPASADTVSGTNSAIKISHTGTGNLLQLQQSGNDKFVVANNGGLTVNGADSSIVRTLFASPEPTQSIGTSLTAANGQIELSDTVTGGIPNSGKGTIATGGTTLTYSSGTMGAGAFSITRPDGKYFVYLGGGASGAVTTSVCATAGTATNVFDPVAGTFSIPTAGNAAQCANNAIGAGALALPRPDGRYRVIHGGAATTTSLIDPTGTLAVGGSVAVNASGAGTVAFKKADGRFLFTNGGAATTQIYDPILDSFIAGPSLTTGTAAAGALVLPRPDGQALIVVGGATGNTQLYNPNSAASNIGVFSAGPVMGTGCESNGAGTVALKRADGKYVVLSKLNASTVYDPVANTFTCSTTNGPATALGDGAHAIPLQNGTFLIIVGGGSQNAYIYNPNGDSYTTYGATPLTAVTTGAHSFMRNDGKWQIIVGGGTATNTYDTGLPMTGTTTKYVSDDIPSTSINASSILKWTAQFEAAYTGTTASPNTGFSTLQFFVRTATNSSGCTTPLNAATDREVLSSGDLIRPGSTDNCIRLTVQFNRPIPKRIVDDRGTWTGNGSTVTRLDYATPTVFDLTVDNSNVLHRSNFDFALPNADTAAPQTETSGPVATRVEASANGVQLPFGRNNASNMYSTGGLGQGLYPGVMSGAHPALPQAQTNDGTIVITRPNKTFVVIAALTTAAANAALYDPATQTFTTLSGSNMPTSGFNNGAGGFAIKRPDGKFLVVAGGATTNTNIYDPDANTFSAGPNTTVAVGAGGFSIANADGTYTIVHGGGVTSSSIYDPVRNTMIIGPITPANIQCGAFAIPRPKFNQYYVTFGSAVGVTGSATSSVYDAQTKIFSATAQSSVPAVANSCGSVAFQRQDGLWVVLTGAGATANTTGYLYNPDNNLSTTLGLTFSNLGRGEHVIPKADGTFLIVNGNGSTITNLYIPWGGAFLAAGGVAGSVIINTASPPPPVTQANVGQGGLSFQRPDGKWVIINGNATNTVNLYDAGWYADGQYLSEQAQVPALTANSTLEWKQTADNYVRMEVRYATSQAALATAPYYSVGRSGQSIGNTGNETWVQVEINMRRDFSTFGINNGVYKTSGMVYPYRTVAVPAVTEYKINNGMDLLTLQDNGLNVFRVTENGSIYSGASGGFYAGGADLAEYYTSSDTLSKGDIVTVDGQDNQSVKQSKSRYQQDMLGVVSTDPGFIGGQYTPDSSPIALAGRVPVNVSNENGMILAGDRVTSGSLPGRGMKAIGSGRVIGVAMESMDDSKWTDCPAANGVSNNHKCQQIMVFVNLADYSGQSASDLMQSAGFSSAAQTVDALQVNGNPLLNADYAGSLTMLGFLKQVGDPTSSLYAGVDSEILAKNINATGEVVAPLIVTDTLVAKHIKAESIEGLEFIQTDISNAQSSAADSATQVKSLGQQITDLQTAMKTLTDNTNMLNTGTIKTLTTDGALTVGGPAEFQGPAMFKALAEFVDKVVFHNNVAFEGQVTFNQDTAGYATVKTGNDNVIVTFAHEYATPPVVNANLSLQQIDNNEVRKASEDLLLITDARFIITNVTTKGFEIKVAQKALSDIPFSWTAIAVKDAKTFDEAEAVPVMESAISSSQSSNSTDKTDLTDGHAAPVVLTTPSTTPATSTETTSPVTSDTTPTNSTIPDATPTAAAASPTN